MCIVDYSPRVSVIGGEKLGDLSGGSMLLSSNGSIAAVGAFIMMAMASLWGTFRGFEWKGSDYIRRGGGIDGEQFMMSLALQRLC